MEFVKTPEEADVILLWLIPNNGGLFSATDKDIDISLSAIKLMWPVYDLKAKKPTIIVVNFSNPWIIEAIETPRSPTVLATYGTTLDALLDVVTGRIKPTGKMPVSIPVSQNAVQPNLSDVPRHLKANGYALFVLGMGWVTRNFKFQISNFKLFSLTAYTCRSAQ